MLQMRTSISQTTNETDQTAFDTFVQQESTDLSGTASEQISKTFTIGGWLQSPSSILQEISGTSAAQSYLLSQHSSTL